MPSTSSTPKRGSRSANASPLRATQRASSASASATPTRRSQAVRSMEFGVAPPLRPIGHIPNGLLQKGLSSNEVSTNAMLRKQVSDLSVKLRHLSSQNGKAVDKLQVR